MARTVKAKTKTKTKTKTRTMAVAAKPKKMGRPPSNCFTSPERFEQLANEFFAHCDASGELKTITGLAVHLGTWRQKIFEWEKKPEFRDAIKRAKIVCEHQYEILALTAKNPAGAIFILKNMDWSDKQEVEHSGQQASTIIIQGLYGQPGDVPIPAGTVVVERPSATGTGRAAVLAAAGVNGNGGGNGNGNGNG